MDSALGLPRPRGLCTFVASTVRGSALLLLVAAELTGMGCGATGASEVLSVLSSLFGVELLFLLVLPPTPAEQVSSRLPVRAQADTPPPRATTLRPALGLSTPTTLLVPPLGAGLVALLLRPGERVAPLPALT